MHTPPAAGLSVGFCTSPQRRDTQPRRTSQWLCALTQWRTSAGPAFNVLGRAHAALRTECTPAAVFAEARVHRRASPVTVPKPSGPRRRRSRHASGRGPRPWALLRLLWLVQPRLPSRAAAQPHRPPACHSSHCVAAAHLTG